MSSSVREGTTDLQVKSLGPCDPGIAWGSEDGSEVEDQTEWSLNSLVGEEEHRLVFGHEEKMCNPFNLFRLDSTTTSFLTVRSLNIAYANPFLFL